MKVVTVFPPLMVVSHQIFHSSIKAPDAHKLQMDNFLGSISQRPEKIPILTNIRLLYLVAADGKELTIKRAP